MAASGHALLGPSSSHRWLHCTPSARLEESIVDHGSEFAQEGSCAHALCEKKLWTLLGAEKNAEIAEREMVANDKARWYNTEMETCAEEYVSIVWNKYQEALKTTSDAKLFVERKLSFEKWVPESFGTADAVIIADGLMEVIDFKYGRGVEVSAVDNTQMMIYALGAIDEYECAYNIERVRMTIIQPRLSNTSEHEMTSDELLSWADKVLAPAAVKAWKGEGEQNPGEWCRFCKIKAKCAKLANNAIHIYTSNENKEEIDDADFPKILSLIPAIKMWCSAVEDYATAKAISGHEFPGYKLVEGRSIRKITDPTALADILTDNNYTDIYKPAELKTIGELEKLVGKKKFYTLSEGLIEKPKGKPTLVPNSDKREPMNVNTAADDFRDIVV